MELNGTAALSSHCQHFLVTLPGQYELVEFIMVKDCYSHHFTSWLDLRGLFASFRSVFAVDFAILELHKGFIWVELVDNIVLKVGGSHRILDFVICCHRFAWYFVVLEYLVTIVGHLGFCTFGTLQRKLIIIVELHLYKS